MTTESLTLSASLFHANVDSWLPANFGVTKPESSKQKDWEAALRTSRGERLGLGHPDLADPTARATAATQRAGIELLNRKLQKRKEENEKFVPREDEEDEEESRGKSVKKRKRVDPFKKGESKVHPLLNLKNPIPGYVPTGKEGKAESEVTATSTSSKVAAAAIKPPSPKVAKVDLKLVKPKPKAEAEKAVAEPVVTSPEPPKPVDVSKLSKTQLRHLKRKQQKLKNKTRLKATSKL